VTHRLAAVVFAWSFLAATVVLMLAD